VVITTNLSFAATMDMVLGSEDWLVSFVRDT
jgi:hypothetical protein